MWNRANEGILSHYPHWQNIILQMADLGNSRTANTPHAMKLDSALLNCSAACLKFKPVDAIIVPSVMTTHLNRSLLLFYRTTMEISICCLCYPA